MCGRGFNKAYLQTSRVASTCLKRVPIEPGGFTKSDVKIGAAHQRPSLKMCVAEPQLSLTGEQYFVSAAR